MAWIVLLLTGALAVTIVLPILSFLQASKALRLARIVEERLAALETLVRRDAGAPSPAPAPARPNEFVEPPAIAPAGAHAADAGIGRSQIAQPPELVAQPHPSAAPDVARSLEARIGARWLLYVGVASIVVGAGFFVKYAFESQWITEVARVLIGASVGGILVVAGVRFVGHGYPLYGRILAGGGLAVLYLSVYAAFNFYQLVGQPTAFTLMLGVTALAAALADRHRARGLALMAVTGGFATPFLVGGNVASQQALFGYDAILVAGAVALAGRRRWPLLNLVSYVATVATVAAWADRFYTPAGYLVTEAFLTLFLVMFLYIRRRGTETAGPAAQLATLVLSTAPVLYHGASLLNLNHEPLALLVYLIAFNTAFLVVAGREASNGLRLVIWLGVMVPYAGWLEAHASAGWIGPGAATLLALYATHLLGQLERVVRDRRSPDDLGVLLLHLNGLWLLLGGYQLIENDYLAWAGALAAVLAGWNLLVAAWVVRQDRTTSLHFLALAATLLAAAVALELDGAWVTVAWAMEGVGIVWLGLREQRGWMRRGGVALLSLSVSRLVWRLLGAIPAGYDVGLNARVGSAVAVIALCYLLAALYRRKGGELHHGGRRAAAALLICANALTLVLLSAEITAFWQLHGLEGAGRLAREMTLSVTWAAYAAVLIVVGIRREYAPIRYLAIAVFGVTILKVFVLDLTYLDRIYRIGSVVALGILLLLASYLYQARGRSERPAGEAADG